jgi:hypothetical protein
MMADILYHSIVERNCTHIKYTSVFNIIVEWRKHNEGNLHFGWRLCVLMLQQKDTADNLTLRHMYKLHCNEWCGFNMTTQTTHVLFVSKEQMLTSEVNPPFQYYSTTAAEWYWMYF